MLIITNESHTDHNINQATLDMIIKKFANKNEFFIETFEVEQEVPCGLYGPIMGDAAVPESEVSYEKRGGREWDSRLVDRKERMVKQITIIAGPNGDDKCVLYTAFGGPLAPKEPGDTSHTPESLAESKAFWSKHALVA